jgi:hypothetical protein
VGNMKKMRWGILKNEPPTKKMGISLFEMLHLMQMKIYIIEGALKI